MTNAEKIISALEKYYKYKEEKLSAHQPTLFKMLISTIISQRNTDTSTFKVSKALFAKYKSFSQLAKAPIHALEKILKPAGFYKTKAGRIREVSRLILLNFNGKVPSTYEKLLSLPGVGRKTAGIIITYGFGKTEGIPVDTHVFRVANRLGLANAKTPEKTEVHLLQTIPKKHWLVINELFITHGRHICLARKPKCEVCPVKRLCRYYKEYFIS